VVPLVLLLAAALVSPGVAFAASEPSKEGLSGYGKEEPKKEEPKKEAPKEEPKKEAPKEEPKSGTSPSKEATTPTKESAPESKSAAPSTSEPAKSSTLPFTGLDLRVVIAVGILMMGAGFSILVVQRRQRKR
jgi:2-oxoglutarate dehydrogenase E2 component (dihydrolipoamide succinyltransferase)